MSNPDTTCYVGVESQICNALCITNFDFQFKHYKWYQGWTFSLPVLALETIHKYRLLKVSGEPALLSLVKVCSMVITPVSINTEHMSILSCFHNFLALYNL